MPHRLALALFLLLCLPLAHPATAQGSDQPTGTIAVADTAEQDAAIAVRSPLPSEAAAEMEGAAAKADDIPLDERERLVLPEVTLPLAIEVPDSVA